MQTTGRSSGRQEPLNCHCEGLLIKINKSVFYCLYFCESHWPPSALHAIVIFSFPFAILTNLFFIVNTKKCQVEQIYWLWFAGLSFCPQRLYHLRSFLLVTAGRDSVLTRQQSISYHFAGWNFRMNFTLFICSFFIEAVRHMKNQPDSRSNTTGLY